MTDNDMDALSQIWITKKNEVDATELKTKLKTRINRIKLFALMERIFTLCAVIAVIILMANIRELATYILGGTTILALIGGLAYAEKLRNELNTVTTGDAHKLLMDMTNQYRAKIKYLEAGIYGIIPSTILGALLGMFIVGVNDNQRKEVLTNALGDIAGLPLILLGGVIIFILLGVCILLLRRTKEHLVHIETQLSLNTDSLEDE